MTNEFTAVWNAFRQELEVRNRRLRKEIEGSWNNLETILQKHADAFTPEIWGNLQGSSFGSIQEMIGTRGAALLFDPLLALRKTRSQERVIYAIDKYPTDIEDTLRLLPQTLIITRADLAGSLSCKMKPLNRLVPGAGSKPRMFSVRDAARAVLQRYLEMRIRRDGRMVLLMARASFALLGPWELFRNEALKSIEDGRKDIGDMSRFRERWLSQISALKAEAARNLAAYDALEKHLIDRIALALLSDRKGFSMKRLNRAGKRWQQYFSYCSALQRSVVAELELEYSSGKLLENAVGISSESLASVDEEHAQILAELDKVRGWLDTWDSEGEMEPFPPPEARLMSSQDRLTSWSRRLSAAAAAVLPVHVEFINPKYILPGRRQSRRSLEPENCFVTSVVEVGREIALRGFREAEECHRAVIREIERAREVAAYSMEGDVEETVSDSKVAEEGILNAVSLLDYQKQSIKDIGPVLQDCLAKALATSFYQFHLSIDESKLGLFNYFIRRKSGTVLRMGARSLYGKMKTGLRLVRDRSVMLRDRILIAVGWAPPSTIAIEPVVRREYLGELLRLNIAPRELPALYKRLFRLAPIEDPRFLVGRDAEIGAMAQARRQWEEGRPVSILVAGARGSGKTSLLNCAHMAVFNDLSVTCGQFRRRITSPAELNTFLSSLFQVDPDALRPFLESGKKLVILEEVERTFIRDIGGFQALRALLNIISATSKNTLWILSLNQAALKYLENVLSFEESFTHIINAMAVSPQNLTDAIVLRHNLSGLRLELPYPNSDNSRLRSFRRFVGLEMDREQAYFESLYRQSDGIFRSAFELWLQSVDRVEGGVLYMLSPAEPEYGKMLSQLTLEDGFNLQAILQHGSLTEEELAQVFDESVENSGRCLNRLIAWDLIEEDPNGPGYRVRPAAGKFVRNALYRQNLL